MKITKKNTRLQAILQALILFGFALYCIGVVVSGSVYRYVHERQVPVLLFSAVVFLIIGVLKLRQGTVLPQCAFSGGRGSSGIFSLAVFAAALTGMLGMSGTSVRFSQFAYTDSIGGQAAAPFVNTLSSEGATYPVDSFLGTAATATDTTAYTDASAPVITQPKIRTDDAASTPDAADPAMTEQNMQTSDGGIVMDSDTFAPWLTELYTKPDAWVGKKITATGSVWKDAELFEKDEFALARMMMTCCAADMQPVGVLAQWNDVQALTDGEWIEVSGTLSKKPYKDSFDPLILVETIKKINPPQREYIYP